MKRITIFTTGISRGNPGPAAIGVQLVDAKGGVIREAAEMIGNAASSFAQYYAVMSGLQTAIAVFGKSTRHMEVEVRLDSDVVKRQLSGECQIKEPGIVPFFIEIHNLRVSSFPRVTFTFVRNDVNRAVIKLATETLAAN